MNYGIVIATILLEILIIGGVSWVLKIRSRHNPNDFINSGRNMPMIAVAATQALTALGGGHILGLPGASWSFGVAAYWYIIASGVMLIIMLNFTGPWIRRLGYTTINEVFTKMFNKKTSLLMAGIAAGTVFGILTLEIQGVGTVIAAMTAWPIAIGCVIGGVIAFLYVIFGGMKEVGWVNVFNAVFMYVGALIALFYIGNVLPEGWAGVNNFYKEGGNDWMLSIWANADTWKAYIVGTFLANLFYCPIGPQAAQISASARNVNALRKSVAFAVPLNCIFGGIMIAFGMAAFSLPEYQAIGIPPIATFAMLLDKLPVWLVVWLFAAFAAAMLSTVAIQILALSTSMVKDVYVGYYNPKASAEKQTRLVRIGVLVFAVVGTTLSTTLPAVSSAIVWLFAWLLPAFWVFTFGVLWKRSSRAAFWTLLISGIANMVWTFSSLPTMLGLDGNNNSIGMIVVSFVLAIILTATDKNAKPALAKVYKENKQSIIAADMAN